MKKIVLMVMVSMLSLSIVAGCGSKTVKPVAIQPDVDKCAVCNMQVSDDSNASEIVLKNGKALKFDDIGCMHAWLKTNGEDQVAGKFVRDKHTKQWVPLENAAFAYDASFKTPMFYGIYSFANMDEAKQYVAEQGKGTTMSANDLDQHAWERNKDMMKKMMMQKMTTRH